MSGADAADFLQGQLTQSVADLDSSDSVVAGWCSAKGRLLALFRVLRADEDFLLVLPGEQVAGVIRRLRLFVLRARVTIEDDSDSLGVLGVALSSATDALDDLEFADEPDAVAGTRIRTVRLRGPGRRYLALVPGSELRRLWDAAVIDLVPVTAEVWRLLDIEAGMPEIVERTSDLFVPQMLNLEPLGGISYHKGCYPGQEVVARMHYLGRLKRRMFRLAVTGTDVPPPGAAVRGADGGEQGRVVNAAPDRDGGVAVLAVLRGEAQGTPLFIDERRAEMLALPYAPPETAADAAGAG